MGDHCIDKDVLDEAKQDGAVDVLDAESGSLLTIFPETQLAIPNTL